MRRSRCYQCKPVKKLGDEFYEKSFNKNDRFRDYIYSCSPKNIRNFWIFCEEKKKSRQNKSKQSLTYFFPVKIFRIFYFCCEKNLVKTKGVLHNKAEKYRGMSLDSKAVTDDFWAVTKACA